MSWSEDYPSILNYLKQNNSYFHSSSSEFITHCPYCDDSLRKNADDHGHLYISKTMAVFHCFRCSVSGHLSQLLKDIGFNDQSILTAISNGINYTFRKEKYLLGNRPNDTNIYNDLIQKSLNFKTGLPDKYNKFKVYIDQRIGKNIEYTKFLLLPALVENKLAVNFFNFNNVLIGSRFIDFGPKRYKMNSDYDRRYFFQEMDFIKYHNIVLCEGPFDIINLYLYGEFDINRTFFMSISSKSFVMNVKDLIINDLRIGNYTINLIFDNDDKNQLKTLYFIRKICSNLNSNITINGYRPCVGKDVAEFPAIEKL